MKRPMMFWSTGDCGCSGYQADTPCPPPGATVSDDRYYGLASAPQGQIIVVPKGSNSQAFLSGPLGFVMQGSTGESAIVEQPVLNLPAHNPKDTNSAYPVPGDFKFLFVGTGDPMVWKVVGAPTVGDYILQSKDGAWTLIPAGSIPGLDTVGESPLTYIKAGLLSIETPDSVRAPNVYEMRRLKVYDKRVVVGDIAEDTGKEGFRCLLDSSPLEHPNIKAAAKLLSRNFAGLDPNGIEYANGFEAAVTTGTGAVTDGTRLWYSPTYKRFFLAPPHTIQQIKVLVTTGQIGIDQNYKIVPGGHLQGVSVPFNYPTVRLDMTVSLSASENVTFGFYRDGALIAEFPVSTTFDYTTSFYDVNVPAGNHTYEVRYKKGPGTATGTIAVQQSLLVIATVPN